MRERKLDVYRAENYESTAEEWSSILQYAFVFPRDVVLPSAVLDSLEVTCRKAGKSSRPTLSVTLQTHVEDIKRKLGAVELSHSENTDDIDLFGWTCQVVDTRDAISTKLRDKVARLLQTGKDIEALKNDLDELIAAKEEHETQLMSKFALLLNEKKLRIRTQQRQLVETDRPVSSGAATKKSKLSRKRKQGAVLQSSDIGEESEGFEAMDVDQNLDDADDLETDQAQMTSTDTDVDSDEVGSLVKRNYTSKDQPPQRSQSATPPPRILPFGKRSKDRAARPEKPTMVSMTNAGEDDDGETASEDDEL